MEFVNDKKKESRRWELCTLLWSDQSNSNTWPVNRMHRNGKYDGLCTTNSWTDPDGQRFVYDMEKVALLTFQIKRLIQRYGNQKIHLYFFDDRKEKCLKVIEKKLKVPWNVKVTLVHCDWSAVINNDLDKTHLMSILPSPTTESGGAIYLRQKNGNT